MATYYADSVNGSDTNDGLSWATAKATIPAALALQTSGNHVLFLRNGFTITSGVTIDSASWSIRGESVGSASITLSVAWQSSSTLRHYFHLITFYANAAPSFNASTVFLSNCTVNSSVSWFPAYRSLIAQSSTLNGGAISNPTIIATRCTFISCSIALANNTAHSFNECIFSSTGIDSYGNSNVSQCSFWNSAIFDRNFQSLYRNCVFARSSAPAAYGLQFQFATSVYYFSGCVLFNALANPTTPAFLLYNAPTTLGSNPFVNPTSGDFSPSAALAAVVGDDGRTPGAIPAAASAGGIRVTSGLTGGMRG